MIAILQKHFGLRIIWQSAAFLAVSVAVGLLANHFRADGLELPGDWSPEARLTLDTGKNIAISVRDAKALSDAGQAIFLDARPYSDYEAGHIQSARSFPWATFEESFENVMADISDEMTLITYCDGETCELSHELAMALIDMGFPKVRVLINGWSLWQQQQFPIAEAADAE